jgi:TRAP-type C4-dicarboxylate transport system permease small subunit
MSDAPQIFQTLPPGAPFLSALGAIYILQIFFRMIVTSRVGPERWEARVKRTEGIVLSTILFTMILLAVLQIVLRNLFRTGVLWIDPLLRYLVLWIGLIGAFAATRRLRHITIDVLGRLLPGRTRIVARAATSFVALVACALLANASWSYLEGEFTFGSKPFLGVPSWAANSILVLGFAAMGWRFLEWVLWPRSGGYGRTALATEPITLRDDGEPADPIVKDEAP